jgi:hypothetical protein
MMLAMLRHWQRRWHYRLEEPICCASSLRSTWTWQPEVSIYTEGAVTAHLATLWVHGRLQFNGGTLRAGPS